MNMFAQQGWQCLICQRIYSPTTPCCFSCPPKTVTTTDTDEDGVKAVYREQMKSQNWVPYPEWREAWLKK